MNKIIREIVRQGLIEYTIPDKPNSHPQEYRLTEAGRRMLPGATQSAMPRKVR
jgi:predicted transcriptional regulator